MIEKKFIVLGDKPEFNDPHPLAPGTYFVLKQGDILAIATMRSYANNALTILELDDVGFAVLSDEQRDYLTELADYASSLADRWEQQGYLKLPD